MDDKVTTAYDAAGRRTKTTLANGTSVEYVYDAASQLTGITHKKSDGSVIGTLAYTYDNNGKRVSASGSLAGVELPNPVTDTQFDANNRLTRHNGTVYTYDANGNLTSDGTRSYVWDERDRLKSIGGAAVASFVYDSMGRRVTKTVAGTTTGFLFDGPNFVQELNGAGSTSPVKANLITGGVDETFMRSASGTTATLSHFLQDGNNNVIALTDSTQNIATSYKYTPYGETTRTGAANENSQQYTGRENDGTGLMYYRARYYHLGCNRFVSEDPIGWASGQTNNYGYVRGDPVGFRDPSGNIPLIVFPVAGAIINGAMNVSRAMSQCQSFGAVVWAGLVGAATGALSTLPVTSISMRAGAGVNAALSLANDYLTGNAFTNPLDALQSAALSAVGGALGAAQAAKAVERTLKSNPIRTSDFHDPALLDALREQATEANSVWQQVPTMGAALAGGGGSGCR